MIKNYYKYFHFFYWLNTLCNQSPTNELIIEEINQAPMKIEQPRIISITSWFKLLPDVF